MKRRKIKIAIVAAAILAGGSVSSPAQTSEVDQLKEQMKAMQQSMDEMKKKIDELEKKQAAQPPAPTNAAAGSPSVQTIEKIAEGQSVGHQSPVADRGNLNDQQEQAPRPDDYTLDPKFRGYVPVPNTPALIKFNAKPRLDAMFDTQNSGNSDRFVPATIPTSGPSAGHGEQFNMTAKGSQLSIDVRAPELPGNFRFFYNNDFFGGGSGMAYRLRHLYGQFYNITAGFTFSVFEDPDVWPDTVDFEGPNSAIFARQPTVRYMIPLNENWQVNLGIQQPSSDIDGGPATSPFTGATANNQAPDGGFNIRWEDSQVGHVQFAMILRDLGAKDPGVVSDQNVIGWGMNLATVINVLERDSMQGQLTFGNGIFHFINDNFVNGDAAYNQSGSLRALQVWGAMGGYTHHWSEALRSTATFGYVDLQNQETQGPDAYHQTYYTSANVVWQLRKHLSIGLEGLYGKKVAQNGDHGDDFRVQLGLVYSLFD